MNRKQVSSFFTTYTSKYNPIGNERVMLKVEHTYRVAGLCEDIAKKEGLSKDQIDLAWLIGMLHDIGRFEQIRIYNTFEDAKSKKHADISVSVLFEEGQIKNFTDALSEKELEIVRKSILYHSEFKLPEDLTYEEKLFADILRDADKIDILKVVYDSNPLIIYGATYEEMMDEDISKEVMKCFDEKHAVYRPYRKTHLDNLVTFVSFIFELVNKSSIDIVNEQGYIWKILEFESNKDSVNEKLEHMRKQIKELLVPDTIC